MRPTGEDVRTRRTYEEELLVGEVVETVSGLLESSQVQRKELASRLGVSPGRVSQMLSGSDNLTLRSLAAVGLALGVRFELHPVAIRDRAGTPAEHDPPAPDWLARLKRTATFQFRPLSRKPAQWRAPVRTFKPCENHEPAA